MHIWMGGVDGFEPDGPTRVDENGRRYTEMRSIIGTVTTGLWCDTCRLPAAIKAPVYLLGKSGVVEIGEILRCLECEPPGSDPDDEVEDDDDDDPDL